MFTGIIETTGKVISLKKEKANLEIGIASSISTQLIIGQSISHNGVCLTVEHIIPATKGEAGMYAVTAVQETLKKTNLGLLKKGDAINLERALRIGDRLDGHFVQGHVDCTATVLSITKEKGSWLFKFQCRNSSKSGLKPEIKNLIIDKGSICINGVSLTVVAVEQKTKNRKQEIVFSVAIIPHTFSATNFSLLKKGDDVNIEFDVLGKYIYKIVSNK